MKNYSQIKWRNKIKWSTTFVNKKVDNVDLGLNSGQNAMQLLIEVADTLAVGAL